MHHRLEVFSSILRGTGRLKPTLHVAPLLLLSACVSRGPEALLRDREAHEPSRISAVAQVSDPNLLWRTMANPKDVLTVRQAAAQRLWSLDGDGFWERVEKEYAGINHGPLWNWLCAEAGRAKEKRALRAMVLSWGKLDLQVGEQERPEQGAIARIEGTRIADGVLQSIVAGTLFPNDAQAQKMAFLALMRSVDGASVGLDLLKPRFPSNSALTALRHVRIDQGPIVEEELEIVIVQAKLPQLPDQTHVPPRDLALARRDLMKADTFTPLSPPVPRTTDAPLLSSAQPSSANNSVCAELVRALRSPVLVASLFAEADADLKDARTEHGGLLLWNDKNEVVFEAVPAVSRRHDQIYLPEERLFEKLRDGLAHVHFHAQKHDNAGYAGPGKGDLEFIERNRVNAVVFTFVDKDTLNADAYFPGKIVVDLGCIKRPK